MLLPLAAVRKRPSANPSNAFDVKAVAFLGITCILASMVSSVIVTSLSIVPSSQAGLAFSAYATAAIVEERTEAKFLDPSF